jgi:hypothetical protein
MTKQETNAMSDNLHSHLLTLLLLLLLYSADKDLSTLLLRGGVGARQKTEIIFFSLSAFPPQARMILGGDPQDVYVILYACVVYRELSQVSTL